MDKKTLKLIYAILSITLIIGVAAAYKEARESLTTLNIETAYVYPKLLYIVSPSPSYIKTVYVKPGAIVKKAQPLVMLDDSILRKTLQMYKTELENVVEREHIVEALYSAKILKIKKTISQVDSEIKALGYELKLQKERERMETNSIKNQIASEIHRITTLKTNISLLNHLLSLCNRQVKGECTVFRANLDLLRSKITYERHAINLLKEKIQTLNTIEKYIEMGIQSSIDSKKQEKLNLKATINENSQVEQLKLKQLALEMLRLENKIRATDIKISYLAIASPLNGIVYKIYRAPGTYVERGQKIASIYSPRDVLIKMILPASYIKYVKVNSKVTVYQPDGKETIPGTIISLQSSHGNISALINIPIKYKLSLKPFSPIRVKINTSDKTTP